jgi:hypothetical protein
LPEDILKIHSYPIIRIIRFLGGISFLFILTKRHLDFQYSNIFLYIAFFFTIIYTIYKIILSFYKIRHMIKVLRSDSLDIKNSPLDRFATFSVRLLWCFKTSCDAAQPIGLGLGIMLGADEILVSANKEPIFKPILGGLLNMVLPEGSHKNPSSVIMDHIKSMENYKMELKQSNSLLERFQNSEENGGLTPSEFKEYGEILNQHKDSLIKERENISSKILEELEKLKNSNK